jgi:hypothetical protein
VCTECVANASDRRRKVRRAIIAAAGAAAAAALAFVVTRPGPTEPGPSGPAVERPGDSADTKRLRARWRDDSCATRPNVNLGEALLRNQDLSGTVDLVTRYVTQCGVERRILWVGLEAHKRLEQWDEALAIADRLVTERPTDINYWWWRAEVREQLGQMAAAAGDYRQSFANRPSAPAADGLAGVRRCQSGFAWGMLSRSAPTEYGWARDRALELLDRRTCAALRGTGGTSVAFDGQTRRLLASATIKGSSLRAIVDPRAGTSVIRKAVLAQLGIAALPGAVSSRVGQAIVTGPPVLLPEIELQGVRAAQVTAIVGEPSASDVDLVLGVNFLWRFVHTPVGYGLLLAGFDSHPAAAEEPVP